MFDVIYMIDYVAIGLTVATLVYLGITAGFVIHEIYLKLTAGLKKGLDKVRDIEVTMEVVAEKKDKKKYDFTVTSISYMTMMLVLTSAIVAFTGMIGGMLVSSIAVNSNHYYAFDIYTFWIILLTTMIYVFVELAKRGELHEPLTKFLARDINPFKRKEGKPAEGLNSISPTSPPQVPDPTKLIPNYSGKYAQEPPEPISAKPKKSLIPDWTGMFANLTKKKDKPKQAPVLEVKKKMELTEEESLIIQKMRIEERMVQEALKKKGIGNNGG